MIYELCHGGLLVLALIPYVRIAVSYRNKLSRLSGSPVLYGTVQYWYCM